MMMSTCVVQSGNYRCVISTRYVLTSCPLTGWLLCGKTDGETEEDGCLCWQPTRGQSSLVNSRWQEESSLRSTRWKNRTLGAAELILKPQPVHGTAHSIVVRQLLNGAWWREAGATDWKTLLQHELLDCCKRTKTTKNSPTAATAGHLS